MNTAAQLIASLTSFSALCTVETIALGFDSPYVDRYGLREFVALIQSADRDETLANVKAQKRALNRANQAVQTRGASVTIGGFRTFYQERGEVTAEDVAAFRSKL